MDRAAGVADERAQALSGEQSVIVMGGGCAGIAAAVRLAEEGWRVRLIETRKRLGGRATSHLDPQTGQLIDNCQHVLLGCCTNLMDLYERLGVADRISWHRELHFFDKQDHHDVLKPARLPAPLHLGPAMLRFTTLSAADRNAINRAMLSMLRMGRSGREAVGGQSFEDWLLQHGQTQGAMERFWQVIIVSACNEIPRRLSARYAIQVFQDGFMSHRRAYEMGVSDVPLAELYDRAAVVIEQRGGSLMLGRSVERIIGDERGVRRVILDGNEAIEAQAYISALPFDRLYRAIDPAMIEADPRLGRISNIGVSPIIGIHLWFDQPAMIWPHMIFVDSPLQWVFGKVGEFGRNSHLHGVISAAHQWVGQSQEQITRMAMEELAQYHTSCLQARLVRSLVIKEKRATFACAPGIDLLRPGAEGPIENFKLAGDWTDTGWPATMEGAVRSGYAAAGGLLGREVGIADLPMGWIPRLLGRG